VRLLRVEKLPEAEIIVVAELIVAGVPDPPAEPLPAEPLDLLHFEPRPSLGEASRAPEMVEAPEPDESSGWRAWLRTLWD
jgi:hypothetical protein